MLNPFNCYSLHQIVVTAEVDPVEEPTERLGPEPGRGLLHA
jgi:hypothetical protein